MQSSIHDRSTSLTTDKYSSTPCSHSSNKVTFLHHCLGKLGGTTMYIFTVLWGSISLISVLPSFSLPSILPYLLPHTSSPTSILFLILQKHFKADDSSSGKVVLLKKHKGLVHTQIERRTCTSTASKDAAVKCLTKVSCASFFCILKKNRRVNSEPLLCTASFIPTLSFIFT